MRMEMAPDELQGTVLEHADRLREYPQAEDNIVMLLEARGQFKKCSTIDIGHTGEDDWAWETESDVAATGKSDHCYFFGGMDLANACPTSKGKGQGKDDDKGDKGHEKVKGHRHQRQVS